MMIEIRPLLGQSQICYCITFNICMTLVFILLKVQKEQKENIPRTDTEWQAIYDFDYNILNIIYV